MSISAMRTRISFLLPTYGKDADGFRTVSEQVIACVLSRKEIKNATEKWKNNTVLQDVSAIFTFRARRGVSVDTSMRIAEGGTRYEIVSVEDVRARGMYVQVLAKRLEEAKDGGEAGSDA